MSEYTITIDFLNPAHMATISFAILCLQINASFLNDEEYENAFSVVSSLLICVVFGLIFLAGVITLLISGISAHI